MGANPTCTACKIADRCGKGCPAAMIAAGQPDRRARLRRLPGRRRWPDPAPPRPGMRRRGLLVSIDEPGGAGRSTVLRLASRNLTDRGLRTCHTAEPSPTPLGNLIRASTDTYTGTVLACLVAGDRHHHLASVTRPSLNADTIVLPCARSTSQ